MRNQYLTCSFVIGSLVATACCCHSQTSADQGQSTPRSQSASNAGADEKSGEEHSKSLRQQYLQKQHELAEHQHNAALETNRDVGLIYSKQTLLRLQQQMEYTGLLLKLAQHQDQSKSGENRDSSEPSATHGSQPMAASLKLVQQEAELANQRLQWAREANAEVIGSILPREMRTYELRAELAELAVKRAKQEDFASDPMEHLQWQLNRLRSDLRQLQIEIEKTEPGS